MRDNTKRFAAGVAALALWATPTLAGAPVAGSEDYDTLTPYAGWIQDQVGYLGIRCCSVSDCRVTPYRITNAGYEAFIALADEKGFTKFPGAPNKWVAVPNSVLKRDVENPTGQFVSCWSASRGVDGGFYCAFPPELG